MVVLVSVLVFLVWKITLQEAAVSEQQANERQEATADRLVATLHQELTGLDSMLAAVARTGTAPTGIAADTAVVYLSPDIVRAWPSDRVAYFPDLSSTTPASDEAFDQIDELEYATKDFTAAAAAYARLADAPDPGTRARALAGLARNQRNAGRPTDALAAYDRLGSLGDTIVAGVPARLAGLLGSLAVSRQQGDATQVAHWSAAIRELLESRRYALSRATFLAAQQDIGVQFNTGSADAGLALAEAIAQFWRIQPGLASGRMIVRPNAAASYLVVWHRADQATAVMAMAATAIARDWLPSGATVQLLAQDGRVSVESGRDSGSARPSIRLLSTTLLPWTVQVSSPDASDATASRQTRTLLLTGLGVVLLLLVVGGVIVGRAITRELRLARMQSDFVAGVSHEFRSPLTAIIQTSELLVRGRVATDSDRDAYYQSLYAESRRLHRLVENVLMFGGLEAGHLKFRADSIDVRALVAETVQQCVRSNPEAAARIRVRDDVDQATARGDRDALQMMLANLIDNALKYSPDGQDVTISVSRGGDGRIELAVADCGIGIPVAERDKIFDKFVRGSAALERQIRGTGVGLALAREIARAHGGDITVESELGSGSRFRVTLA